MITMSATVNDVMTTTVVAVKQGASYKEMATLLRKYRVSAFPVLDDQKVIGIVSEADPLAKAALNPDRGGAITALVHHTELTKADGVTAGDLMSSNVVTIKPDDMVEQAARLMYRRRRHRHRGPGDGGPGPPHRGQDPARSGRRGRSRQARLPARRGIVRRPALLNRDQGRLA